MCKPEIADFLNQLFDAVKQKKQNGDYPDIPYRILDLLIRLSSNMVEVNQHREPVRSVLKEKQDEQVSISSIDSLQQWVYEESSDEEESSEEPKHLPENNQQNHISDIIEQQKPNILYYVQPMQKRTFTEFLSDSSTSIKGYQLFQPEFQNQSQQITKQNYITLIAQERDLVCAVLYSFLGAQSELLIFQNQQFSLGDVDVAHLSHESLMQHVEQFIQLANILVHLRKAHYVAKPSFYNVEALIQEQFWISVDEIIKEFENEVCGYLELVYLHGKEFKSDHHQALTILQLNQKISKYYQVFIQINQLAKLDESKSLFSSPTLKKLYNICIQNQLQNQELQIIYQRIFYACLDPYLKLIDKYLDFNANMTADFQDIPPFLEGCVVEMKNISQAYQIFMKIPKQNIQAGHKIYTKQIKFREKFLKKIARQTQVPIAKLETLSLQGGFELENPFEFSKPVKQESEQNYYTSTKIIQDVGFIKIFAEQICESIKEEDQAIQQQLLNYIDTIFPKIQQFIRSLYFFERVDYVTPLLEKLEYNISSLRVLQNSLIENLSKICEVPINIINRQGLQINMLLPHPIDLIVTEQTQSQLNRVLQFLHYFKHSKQQLLKTHLKLKKQKKNQQKIKEFLHFTNELISFMNNYEYFLFISIIQQQMIQFQTQYKQIKTFDQLIDGYNSLIKTIQDKMFLNQKSESILQAITKIIDIVQNYSTLVDRAIANELLDSVTRDLEWNRIISELDRAKKTFNQQVNALVLLFNTNTQRFSHALESIIKYNIILVMECVLKINFNRFYDQ